MPYVYHPFHLAEQMDDEYSTCVALLHDVVEDTDINLEDLKKDFPPEVTDAIALMTHDDSVPYLDYVREIKKNPLAAKVKLADLRHNSDVSRLDKIDRKTNQRIKKYKEAIEILTEISVPRFLKVLKNIETLTPKTVEFDREHGQMDRRWWDKIGMDCWLFSKQKYHIYGTFICAAYNKGKNGTDDCDWTKCAKCYRNNGFNKNNNELGCKFSLSDKFNNLERPEMYLWFVEAFELLKGKKLKRCFSDVAKMCSDRKPVLITIAPQVKRLAELKGNNYDLWLCEMFNQRGQTRYKPPSQRAKKGWSARNLP